VHHFAAADRLRRNRHQPLPGLRDHRRHDAPGLLTDITAKRRQRTYVKAAIKGVVKTMSKMGISTIQSYCGAQIFEALGLHQSVIDKYFTWTPSRIGGIDLDVIAQEANLRHKSGLPERSVNGHNLERRVPVAQRGRISPVQPADHPFPAKRPTRSGDYALFKSTRQLINDQIRKAVHPARAARVQTRREPSRWRKSNRSSRSASASRPAR
jgi:glutamate synthase domain-containing protein 2